MRTQVLGDIERLLVPPNMEILWGHVDDVTGGVAWLEWFWEFVVPHPTPASRPAAPADSSSFDLKANVSDRTHELVLFIAQKMMLYGILQEKDRKKD